MMLLEHCDHIMLKVAATVTWLHVYRINVCLVTWLDFFFLYVKFFVPSIFNSVAFWSSMSCNSLVFELADKNVNRELGVFFLMEFFSDTHFVVQTGTNPQKKFFCCRKNLQGIVWNKGCLTYRELLSIPPRDLKVECFAKRQKNANIFVIHWMKRSETWIIMAAPKLEILLSLYQMKKSEFVPVTPSNRKPQFTLCRAQPKNAWSVDNTAFEVFDFVLWIVLSVSTPINFLKCFNFFCATHSWVKEGLS